MTTTSVSADSIARAYIDEATKAALLGPGNSFGLPRSTITTFKVSELADGIVELIPAHPGKMIVPFSVLCGTGSLLAADISANLGWPAPPDDDSAHNEPWLSASTPLFYAGEELGSFVQLPNANALITPRLWPECVRDRAFAVGVPASGGALASKNAKKDEKHEKHVSATATATEAPVDPELSIVVFYTVF